MAQSTPHAPLAILVVDDEVIVRMDLADSMQRAGFDTYEAGSADEAIRILEAHPEIGVLFTDIDMPGPMNGVMLAHYVHDRWPPVRIVVVSGHVEATVAELPDDAVFIGKPFQDSELNRAIRTLDRRPH